MLSRTPAIDNYKPPASEFEDPAAALISGLAIFLLAVAGCSPQAPPSDPNREIFAETAQKAGIQFHHFNGMVGELYFSEIMGSGVALLDFDNDGDLDVYLVQGAALDPTADSTSPEQVLDRIYRNDGTLENGHWQPRFTDVSEQAGLDATGGYGMGVAAGDYDNDGFVDLYLSNFGSNQLLRNQGDGTFADVTAAAGVQDLLWSVSAAWADLNHDGWLDLYVGNYVEYSIESHKVCRSPEGAPRYCWPLVFDPQPDSLFINDRKGNFINVSKSSGIREIFGGALGVITADFNQDGRTDIYVANDSVANQLWINQGDGTFEDNAELAGVAVNMAGSPEASMGVAASDFDSDGDEDLFMTHVDGETNTLYVNDGKGWFEDRTIVTGLGDPSLQFTGFGTGWLDFDGDGLLDLFSANGAVIMIKEQVARGDPYPLKQTNQLFKNLGDGVYKDVSSQAGVAFELAEVSRGAAFGDIDNDGDTDIVVSNNNGPVRLLMNMVGQDNNWIGARLMVGKRDALGARATVLQGERPTAWRRAHTDGSYASSNDPRVLFSLTEGLKKVTLLVHWPDGSSEIFPNLPAARYHELRRGNGEPANPDLMGE